MLVKINWVSIKKWSKLTLIFKHWPQLHKFFIAPSLDANDPTADLRWSQCAPYQPDVQLQQPVMRSHDAPLRQSHVCWQSGPYFPTSQCRSHLGGRDQNSQCQYSGGGRRTNNEWVSDSECEWMWYWVSVWVCTPSSCEQVRECMSELVYTPSHCSECTYT